MGSHSFQMFNNISAEPQYKYKQMPSPQKTKGSSWEREIADFLTKTYGEKFMRSPGSGAYVGGTNIFRKQQMQESTIRVFKGDIIPGESFPRLNVECKSYKDFAFHQLLQGNTVKQLEDWIDQCMTAADINDLSIMFMKFSRKGSYIATPARPLFLSPPTSIQYQSKNHGVWIFAELNSFFDLNQQYIKIFSQPDTQS